MAMAMAMAMAVPIRCASLCISMESLSSLPLPCFHPLNLPCSSFATIRPLKSSLHSGIAWASFANGELKSEESLIPEQQIRERFQDVADSLVLPAEFFRTLPKDLQVDVKNAAFSLANGPVKRECGEQMGSALLLLSQAWENADVQAAAAVALDLEKVLPKNSSSRAFLGKRLVSAGKQFGLTGQYGQGELQKIAKTLIAAGEAVLLGSLSESREEPDTKQKTFKFGELQVELTSARAYVGSAVALIFGGLSWQLTSALQNISENSLQYANDNAVLLATSLRGTLLALGYSCTIFSAVTMVALFSLAIQLAMKEI